jgi:hypothetical protein
VQKPIIVTHEFRLYREVLAEWLRSECPGTHLILCEPDELGDTVRAGEPRLVICSWLPPQIEEVGRASDLSWIVWHPTTGDPSIVRHAGEERKCESIALADILEVVKDVLGSDGGLTLTVAGAGVAIPSDIA